MDEKCDYEVYGRTLADEFGDGMYIIRCKTHRRNFFSKSDDPICCPWGRELVEVWPEVVDPPLDARPTDAEILATLRGKLEE